MSEKNKSFTVVQSFRIPLQHTTKHTLLLNWILLLPGDLFVLYFHFDVIVCVYVCEYVCVINAFLRSNLVGKSVVLLLLM